MRVIPTVSHMLTLALVASLSLASACDDDDDIAGIDDDPEFQATLTGASERPDPVTTSATGAALIEVDGTMVNFRVEVEDIQAVTMAHIHFGATDVAGPIVVELFNAGGNPVTFTDRDVLAEGTFTQAQIQAASGIATLDALITAMLAGTTYVNVHTTANPAGEIRGQLVES